jgi:hypothetical protein
MKTKGALIAAMAAGFLGSAVPFAAQAAETDMVKCTGVNACKGHGACKSKTNACAGKNGCKGKGWTEMTEKDCKDKGGKVLEEKAKDKAKEPGKGMNKGKT